MFFLFLVSFKCVGGKWLTDLCYKTVLPTVILQFGLDNTIMCLCVCRGGGGFAYSLTFLRFSWWVQIGLCDKQIHHVM